jgi:hypothetical protein
MIQNSLDIFDHSRYPNTKFNSEDQIEENPAQHPFLTAQIPEKPQQTFHLSLKKSPVISPLYTSTFQPSTPLFSNKVYKPVKNSSQEQLKYFFFTYFIFVSRIGDDEKSNTTRSSSASSDSSKSSKKDKGQKPTWVQEKVF